MKLKEKRALVLIILLAFLLRLYKLNQSLWLDEAIGANLVKNSDINYIWNVFSTVDNHPPLYYVMLELWSDVFSYSEVALRSLSVFFGVGTVFITYKIAQFLSGGKSRFIALTAALFVATSQFHIYYSQEARMYIVDGFFAASSIYSFVLACTKDKLRNWVAFAVSILIMMFVDYMPVFLLPIFLIYVIFQKKSREWYLHLVSSSLPLLVAGILWLPKLKLQMENSTRFTLILPAWKHLAGGADLHQAALVWIKFTLGRISVESFTLYIGIIILTSIPFIVGLFRAIRKKELILIWLWLAIPLALAFITSYFFPVFNYFRFVYIVPGFYILVAFGINSVRGNFIRIALILSVLVINLGSFIYYVTDVNQQREDWRDAVKFVESNSKIGDIVLFTNPEPFAPYQYYSSGSVDAAGATDSISANYKGTADRTEELILGKSAVYLFDYLSYLHDPNGYVSATLSKEGYSEKQKYDFVGVGFISFWSK